MHDSIISHPSVLLRGRSAFAAAKVPFNEVPIRGGTDGARLSELGVPTPNIFAGGINFHSKSEFVPVSSLAAGCEVVYQLMIAKE